MKEKKDGFYEWLTNIDSECFSDKSILLIGGSEISKQYVLALNELGVKDITVIAKSGNNILKFCDERKVELLTGGYEKNIPDLEKKDLTIIAPSIQNIIPATKLATKTGQTNILIEKPGSLYYDELASVKESLSESDIRVGFNRIAYPNVQRLKEKCEEDGGITSCRFVFTERISLIDFKKYVLEVYQRWGISNSLHVITLAFELIGLPEEIHSYQYGSLKWHPSGSIFVGSGISEQGIPFSYHADWGSGGRWGIEVNTRKNSYQLIPLEDLFVCKKNESEWKRIDFNIAFPKIKQGIAEEVAIMLSDNKKYRDILPSLEKTSKYNKIAEEIFGYR